MAKGQMRSGREAKKPKKSVKDKQKAGAVSAFSQPPVGSKKPGSK